MTRKRRETRHSKYRIEKRGHAPQMKKISILCISHNNSRSQQWAKVREKKYRFWIFHRTCQNNTINLWKHNIMSKSITVQYELLEE